MCVLCVYVFTFASWHHLTPSLSLVSCQKTRCDCRPSDMPRGYMLLTKSVSLPTILFRFSAQVSVTRYNHKSLSSTTAGVVGCVDSLQQNLFESCEDNLSDDELMTRITQRFIDSLNKHGYDTILLTSQVPFLNEDMPHDLDLLIAWFIRYLLLMHC